MSFTETIIKWYDYNKRELPWRATKEPYKVWVSEIILQQTRIDQGLPYYIRFIENFPDVQSLANASEQEVLNVWKGLGYYSRARNMHQSARQVMEQYNGIFPADYNLLIQLKGIGSYTAAAVSSICMSEKKAAIDGNVVRVLSRYYGIQDAVGSTAMVKKTRWISAQLIPDQRPGDYNQAVMEYGALMCTPLNPQCENCELRNSCYAYENKLTSVLPIKKNPVKKKNRYFNYFHIVTPDGRYAVRKRTGDDIWKGLWELPMIESDYLFSKEDLDLNEITRITGIISPQIIDIYDKMHILTHQLLYVRFFTILANSAIVDPALTLIDKSDSTYPHPRLIENFLKRNNIFFGYD